MFLFIFCFEITLFEITLRKVQPNFEELTELKNSSLYFFTIFSDRKRNMYLPILFHSLILFSSFLAIRNEICIYRCKIFLAHQSICLFVPSNLDSDLSILSISVNFYKTCQPDQDLTLLKT